MNSRVIPRDALNRFRHAASQYALTAKARTSRLQALKDDIAALRKRGVPYSAISELLAQSGITASTTCVMNFYHRVLNERRRRPSTFSRSPSNINGHKTQKAAPSATVNINSSAVPDTTLLPLPAPVKTRGPHIAKVELLKPGEQYDYPASQRRVLSAMKAEGNHMSAAVASRMLRVGSNYHSPLPFLLDAPAASKALASRFSSRAPVAARLENRT
jgi:hypothetical protein